MEASILDVKLNLQLCLLALSAKRDVESATMAVQLIETADSRDLLTPDEWCRCFNCDPAKWNNRLPALLNILSLSADPIVPQIKQVVSS